MTKAHVMYCMCYDVLQVPYLIASSVIFTVIFFFTVGFDNDDVTAKFFWYWCFQSMYMSTAVFIGQFVCAALPTAAAAQGK